VIEVVPESWRRGVLKKDAKRITNHLAAIKILREADVNGSGVIGAYHARRVAPLMAFMLPMHRMVPVAQLEGMVLAEGPLTDSEIAQHLKEAMDAPKDSLGAIINFVYPVPRHSPMRPKPSFIRFVSYPLPFTFFPKLICSAEGPQLTEHLAPLPRSKAVRAVNRASNEA
jgi:hypothetical protein